MRTTKRYLLIMLLPMLLATQAFAQSKCRDDKLINTNGVQMRLASGWVMQAYPGTTATISVWEPLDNLTVCPLGGAAYSITDKSQDNKTVKALRQ
jgi:hypothetical protein